VHLVLASLASFFSSNGGVFVYERLQPAVPIHKAVYHIFCGSRTSPISDFVTGCGSRPTLLQKIRRLCYSRVFYFFVDLVIHGALSGDNKMVFAPTSNRVRIPSEHRGYIVDAIAPMYQITYEHSFASVYSIPIHGGVIAAQIFRAAIVINAGELNYFMWLH
jgi:hypothetical protein